MRGDGEMGSKREGIKIRESDEKGVTGKKGGEKEEKNKNG